MVPAGLPAITTYADAIGPNVRAIIPLAPDGHLGTPTALVCDAHVAGLEVHPYTFRPKTASCRGACGKAVTCTVSARPARSPRSAPISPPASMRSSPTIRQSGARRWREAEPRRKKAPAGAFAMPAAPAQLLPIWKSCLATGLPSSEISTLYLPAGHRSGFCTLNVVMAGPSVAIDWLMLLTSWPSPSR